MRKPGVLIALFLAAGFASAQSLKPESPYPMKAGINGATADSFVGTHYWYFYAMPGSSKVTARLKTPTTLYGATINSTLTITLRDELGGRVTKTVNGSLNGRETTFTAPKVEKRLKIVVSVAPPTGTLIRMGGDYEIEATGDVAFDEEKSAAEPIVRTFDPKVSQSGESYGAVKFNADGTIVTANGFTGTWNVFDRENRIYVVQLGRIRYSLQYRPGYGLVEPGDPNSIMFQELRR